VEVQNDIRFVATLHLITILYVDLPDALDYLRVKGAATNAVIIVPTSFNSSQRQAAKDAGTCSVLSMNLQLAYGLHKVSNDRNFDLGGESPLDYRRRYRSKDRWTCQSLHPRFQVQTQGGCLVHCHVVSRLRTACGNTKRILPSVTQTPIEFHRL